MATKPPQNTPSPQAVLRAVASSTTIETGQSVAEIEAKLRSKKGKFRALTLANQAVPLTPGNAWRTSAVIGP